MTYQGAAGFWCRWAVVGDPADGVVAPGVLVEVDVDGSVSAVRTGVPEAPPGAVRLDGLTVPGLANSHSHVFHRALRGRTQGGRTQGGRTQGGAGDFWQWRSLMYAVADRLDPSSLYELALATYAEMLLAGITVVGEFHYLHHGPGGRPYDRPSAMGEAVVAAASDAGVRLTLLDTCYLHGGIGSPLAGAQLRFGDGDVTRWASRVDETAAVVAGAGPAARLGVAVHSVRAVEPDEVAGVAALAAEHGWVLHVHLSEQPAENEACRAAYGRTPTEVLAAAGALGPRTTAVHATHLEPGDLGLLGAAGAAACLCPTTERDLADGVGAAAAMAAAGCRLCLGSDSHAVIDLFEEARATELDERLTTGRRGVLPPASLLAAATAEGYRALGWEGGGRIAPGGPADLTTVSLATPRMAGAPLDRLVDAVVYAATGADVTDVVVAGRHVVRGARHAGVDDVPAALDRAVRAAVGG